MTRLVGTHTILELYGCPGPLLGDAEFISTTLREAANHAPAHLVREVVHAFVPHGVTAVALLAESHIAIHTWPELGYAAIDLFTCGVATTPHLACDYLERTLRCQHTRKQQLERGLPPVEVS